MSLQIFRHAQRQDGLHFILILPDGSKLLIPAAWTDFESSANAGEKPNELVGSFEDLLRARSLVDALLSRRASPSDGLAAPKLPYVSAGE